jgi:UDP-N-acetylmuramoyl-L-alanyl-D-glutamate--2,6-diaminopimelate ligase
VTVIPDRAEAIALAVSASHRGDAVVIAGKGHEQGQDIGGVVHPFDDAAVLREAILSCTPRALGSPGFGSTATRSTASEPGVPESDVSPSSEPGSAAP